MSGRSTHCFWRPLSGFWPSSWADCQEQVPQSGRILAGFNVVSWQAQGSQKGKEEQQS